MSERSFRPDPTGPDESLDDLLSRLKAQLSRPRARPNRYPPPDAGHFAISRRPQGGSGGAEAPIPVDRPLPDGHAT